MWYHCEESAHTVVAYESESVHAMATTASPQVTFWQGSRCYYRVGSPSSYMVYTC